MSLLRAKSRLRRLRSVHACGRSAVGIFAFDKLLRSTTPEIATPVCALVRNDEKGRKKSAPEEATLPGRLSH